MSAPQMTTAEALRTALASTIACSAQELQDAVGRIVVATSAECPDSGSDVRSLSDPHTRTTVLLADRIPFGQEAAAVAREIERHHGRQAAYVVIGDRAEELLGSEGTDPNEFLLSEYSKYAVGVSEGDPMAFDDWLAGSDLPEIVQARQRANLQGNEDDNTR